MILDIRIRGHDSPGAVKHAAVDIVAAPLTRPPFPCVALVQEQDTCLLLGESREVQEPSQPAWYLAHRMEQQPLLMPGTVLVRSGSGPCQVIGIVYDVEAESVCREEWLREVLTRILELARQHAWRSVGMPLLGVRYGGMDPGIFLHCLRETLDALDRVSWPARLWLVWPEEYSCERMDVLRR